MRTTVSQHAFIDAFRSSNTYKDNFTYKGLQALFDYLEDLEQDTGTEIELDIVALCCDFTEATLEYIQSQYPDHEIETLEDLQYYTQAFPVPDTDRIIYQSF
jgi:hypothetical protein